MNSNDRYKIVVFRSLCNIGITGNATKQVFAPAAITLAMPRHESLLPLSSPRLDSSFPSMLPKKPIVILDTALYKRICFS